MPPRNRKEPEEIRINTGYFTRPKLTVDAALNLIPADDAVRYEKVKLSDLTPEWEDHKENTGITKHQLVSVKLGQESFETGKRMLSSFFSRFGQSPSIFSLFTPQEVFGRLQEKHPRAEMRLAIETPQNKLLAVSSPDKSVVSPVMLRGILRHGERPVYDASYANGVVRSFHSIPNGSWPVLGEKFASGFVLDTPIDGYGRPSIYLLMERLMCLNGLIAMIGAFRSELALGKEGEIVEALERNLASFNNEEGFQRITKRLEAARTTPLSVGEYLSLQRALASTISIGLHDTPIGRALVEVFGDLSEKYHVPSEDFIPPKKRAALPMNGSVSDAINFATEVTTHHQKLLRSPGILQAWVGEMIRDRSDKGAPISYDLEGFRTMPEGYAGPKAFYITKPLAQRQALPA